MIKWRPATMQTGRYRKAIRVEGTKVKQMKKITLSLLAIVLFTVAKAQIGLGDIYGGAGFNVTGYLTENGLSKGFGPNLRAGVNFTEKFGACINFNRSFPIKFTSTEYAYPFSSQTPGGSITVTSTRKVVFTEANIRANYFMAGSGDDEFGFYGHLGAGILSYKETKEASDYDPNLYYTTESSSEQTMGLMMGGGLGLQYRSGMFAGFAEFGINLPANEANGESIDPVAVINAGLTVGVKIHFGESDR